MKLNVDKNAVAAADILVPKIGEIIGSQSTDLIVDATMCGDGA